MNGEQKLSQSGWIDPNSRYAVVVAPHVAKSLVSELFPGWTRLAPHQPTNGVRFDRIVIVAKLVANESFVEARLDAAWLEYLQSRLPPGAQLEWLT